MLSHELCLTVGERSLFGHTNMVKNGCVMIHLIRCCRGGAISTPMLKLHFLKVKFLFCACTQVDQ